MTEHICATCRWAEWEMTRHKPPRVNPHRLGVCNYSEDDAVKLLPVAHRSVYLRAHVLVPPFAWGLRRTDTRECPAWEPKP